MRLDDGQHTAKHFGYKRATWYQQRISQHFFGKATGCVIGINLTGNGVYLVENNETPFLASHPLHDPLGFPGALGAVAQHGVGADGH